MAALWKSKNKECDLIIDISSHSVGAVLTDFQNTKPKILFSRRLYLPLGTLAREALEKKTLESLEIILDNLLKEEVALKNKQIRKILCIMSAPWVVSGVNEISAREEKEILITQKTIDALLGKEMSEKKIITQTAVTIEKWLTQIKLNGYLIKNPIGKRAQDIKATAFESRARTEWLEKVEKIIFRRFHRESYFHSHSFILLNAIEQLFPENKNYLLIEITGETTELTIIKNGVIKRIYNFGLGKNIFLKSVAEKFGVEADIALSFLKIYQDKKAEQKFSNAISETISIAEKDWINSLNNFLENSKIKPQTIFLSVDPLFASFFKSYISNYLGKEGERKIISLGSEVLSNFIDLSGNQYDPTLALGLLSLKQIHS